MSALMNKHFPAKLQISPCKADTWECFSQINKNAAKNDSWIPFAFQLGE